MSDTRMDKTVVVPVEKLADLLQWATSQVCQHEETHRGGVLWEICDHCGAKWADDEGGRPEFKWPAIVEEMYDLIAAAPAPAAQDERDELSDDQIRFRFFKHLTADQRLAVFKVFGVYPDDCNESLNHGIETRLLAAILKRRAALTAPQDAQEPVAYMAGDGIRKNKRDFLSLGFKESDIIELVPRTAQPADSKQDAQERNAIIEECAKVADAWKEESVAEAIRALKTAQPADSKPEGCCRSHPHEDMNEECQRKTEEARRMNAAAQKPEGKAGPIAYLVDGRIEQGLTFDLAAAETMADANCGDVVPLCRCTCKQDKPEGKAEQQAEPVKRNSCDCDHNEICNVCKPAHPQQLTDEEIIDTVREVVELDGFDIADERQAALVEQVALSTVRALLAAGKERT